MMTYFTSDLHCNHGNIAAYCNRTWLRPEYLYEPYGGTGLPKWVSPEAATECAMRMTDGLIANINMRCKPEDTLIHVGDFYTRGRAYAIEGAGYTTADIFTKLKCKLVLMYGNHDKNNGIKANMMGMVYRLNGQWTAWVQHRPPFDQTAFPTPKGCNCYLCGHVHDKWLWAQHKGMPVLNIGVDVHKYNPVSVPEIIGMLEQHRKELQ